jgi:hypothetical protein
VWSVLLATVAFPGAASAQTVNLTHPCAELVDNTGTIVSIENGGFVPTIVCHNRGAVLCGEAFAACVNNAFALGGGWGGNLQIPAAVYNLLPSTAGGPFHLCEPFFIPSPGAKPVFLTPTLPLTNPPVYNLDAQDLDGDGMFDDSVPLGTLVQVVLDTPPDPASSNCVGVRTTIQHRVGTCKIWKVRKFYNTCRTNQTLTQIKEFELPCADTGKFAGQAGPGQFLTAVASTASGDYITLQSMGNTGANGGNAKMPPYQRSAAGSVVWTMNDFDFTFLPTPPFNTEFLTCGLTSGFTSARVSGADRWLEVFLSFFPGGVVLKPVGKAGSEKLVTFCIDIQ